MLTTTMGQFIIRSKPTHILCVWISLSALSCAKWVSNIFVDILLLQIMPAKRALEKLNNCTKPLGQATQKSFIGRTSNLSLPQQILYSKRVVVTIYAFWEPDCSKQSGRNKAQISCTGRTSKFDSTSIVFVARKGIYGHLCIFGAILKLKRYVHSDLNNCPQTPRKQVPKIIHRQNIKFDPILYSVCCP